MPTLLAPIAEPMTETGFDTETLTELETERTFDPVVPWSDTPSEPFASADDELDEDEAYFLGEEDDDDDDDDYDDEFDEFGDDIDDEVDEDDEPDDDEL